MCSHYKIIINFYLGANLNEYPPVCLYFPEIHLLIDALSNFKSFAAASIELYVFTNILFLYTLIGFDMLLSACPFFEARLKFSSLLFFGFLSILSTVCSSDGDCPKNASATS